MSGHAAAAQDRVEYDRYVIKMAVNIKMVYGIFGFAKNDLAMARMRGLRVDLVVIGSCDVLSILRVIR